jgi:hypothetical protein
MPYTAFLQSQLISHWYFHYSFSHHTYIESQSWWYNADSGVQLASNIAGIPRKG